MKPILFNKKEKTDKKPAVYLRRKSLLFLSLSVSFGIIIITTLGMYYWPLTLAAAIVTHFVLVDRKIDEIDFGERYMSQVDFPYLCAGLVIVTSTGILVGNLGIFQQNLFSSFLFFIGLGLVILSSNPKNQPKESKIRRYVIYPIAVIITLVLLFGF